MLRIVTLTLLLSTLATPAADARLSIRQAERMVVHRVGLGTVVKHCWWFSRTKDRCSYSTPAENQWNIEEGWTYESAMTV